MTDSKGFYDAVTRSCCSQAISVERRLQIDYYAIAKETMSNQNFLAVWINNVRMVADVLTKLKGDVKPLYDLVQQWKYHIKPCTESGRKEKAKKRPKAFCHPSSFLRMHPYQFVLSNQLPKCHCFSV